MLFFRGSSAFTAFRMQRLTNRLQSLFNHSFNLIAELSYFVAVSEPLSSSEIRHLENLLSNSQLADIDKTTTPFSLWVVPRVGTISPWSSKATDITKICELSKIKRIEQGIHYYFEGIKRQTLTETQQRSLLKELHDPLTESIFSNPHHVAQIFQDYKPESMIFIDVLKTGINALQTANHALGLALTLDDMHYLEQVYRTLQRNPTDVELMMFAQINSEHCRHKIFNAQWKIDGHEKNNSLFAMIKNTYQKNPDQVIVAYKDNAAVIKSPVMSHFYLNPQDNCYCEVNESAPIVFKVETHNHPTAISPFSGAATGSGGEIRDEAATGRGAYSKAGLCGFSVSHLHIPGFKQPWEITIGKPPQMVSALEIMLQGPIGAAAFNNEFGRPNVCGYFRTLEIKYDETIRGYHKPIMIAGGLGHIRGILATKKEIPVGTKLIVLGGPSMAIGLGGGSASSLTTGERSETLDFASVQRANPEMQRRCQEVINSCWALGGKNPILSIHDVGAGGLSNALPELVYGAKRGAIIDFRHIPNAEPRMSPLELWCNEAQERFVLAIKAEDLKRFQNIAERERCPFAVVGETIAELKFIIKDTEFNNRPVDLPLSILFENTPRLLREAKRQSSKIECFNTDDINLIQALQRVLQFPCVADKSFLITIGDRTVGGMISRDQMVGPWQIPVADVAITCNGYSGYRGVALAVGERTPIAIINSAAAARMAVGEVITNIAAAVIDDIADIVLSANWMAAADFPGEAVALYDAVQAIGLELCPALGISIPVGKDSLSMQAVWKDHDKEQQVISPVSLIISATANVADVRRTLTPQLKTNQGETILLLVDLAKGRQPLGGSVLAQIYQSIGQQSADLDDPQIIKNFFSAIQMLNHQQFILAYHDRSDGGIWTTLCEMAFAGHVGLTITLDALGDDLIAALFCEELGAVIQIRKKDESAVRTILREFSLDDYSHVVGHLNNEDQIRIFRHGKNLYSESRNYLQRLWSETSYRMQTLRDHPECAQQEFDNILDKDDPGLTIKLSYDPNENITAPFINRGVRPRVVVLREQGINGHIEMAAVLHQAGFDSIDGHMSDLIHGRLNLTSFKGLVACGGFSYGDVLGAGRGWAQSILMHSKVRDEFIKFFQRSDTFSLGVCNGCQMFSHLKEIIPGATHWPTFQRNYSEQFEARFSLVEVQPSPSIFFAGMEGSCLPVAVAHGEGLVVFKKENDLAAVNNKGLVTLKYVDHYHQTTERYPFNPNGSVQGITGLTTPDGRVTILMPHPERVFRTVQNSWHPDDWGEYGPWMRFFRNARMWVE